MYRSNNIHNYFELLWVLLLLLFSFVCLYGGRGTIQILVKKKVPGDTQLGHNLRPQISENQNCTPEPQAVIRTSEEPEAGNHSNQ